MSTSIRLKNSSALVGGKAKVPTPSDLAQGELAVNINKDDPSLFVKDSEGVVRKIAGSDATGVEGEYLSLAADAEAQTVATSETTTFTGQVDLPGGGNDTQALQKQEVEALIADPDGPADGNYLKLAADAGDQTVLSTDTTTFSGLVEAADGVKVTGGNNNVGEYGIGQGGDSIALYAGNETTISAKSGRAVSLGGLDAFGDAIVSIRTVPHAKYTGDLYGMRFNIPDGPNLTASSNVYGFEARYNATKSLNSFTGFIAQKGSWGAGVGATELKGFAVESGFSNDAGAAYGFYSNIGDNGDVTNPFNFFAANDAPNFYQGNTYIGGTATRNTRELWESLLTEEEKEQLAAGTLAIPANVSTPGDGSFVRQWWYDQQSAEDQALIDAGELDYPERYKAENFVDTFALGDDTRINLLSNGKALFKSGSGGEQVVITAATAQSTDNNKAFAIQNAGVTSCSISYRGKIEGVSGLESTGEIDCDKIDVEGVGEFGPSASDSNSTVVAAHIAGRNNAFSANGRTTNTGQSAGFTSFISPASNVAVSQLIGFNTTSRNFETGAAAGIYKGFAANANIAQATNNYGFWSDLSNKTNTYNFYANGTAPNYFAGPLILDPNSLGVYNGDGFLASKTNTGIRLFANSSEPGNNRFEISSGWRGSSSNQAIVFSGPTSDTDPTPVLRGSIRVSDTNVIYTTDSIGTPAFVEFGDARNRTFTDFNGNAADTIKLLQPKVNGFNPAQLQAVVANAVTGTENEEEAIGTLYDFDGTVLETEVTEPPAEAQSYVTEEGETRIKSWIETGTRPIYQGVDQTKLIPLLTKALQEALERIEQLEAQLGAGGGSDFESVSLLLKLTWQGSRLSNSCNRVLPLGRWRLAFALFCLS